VLEPSTRPSAQVARSPGVVSRLHQLPRDPEFEARVRASFARQRFMTQLGARLAAVAPGVVEIELPVADELSQQHDFLRAETRLLANAKPRKPTRGNSTNTG
jgi:hypothetical protein